MNPIPLPSAATSFYTVRKVRGGWGVILVTPLPTEALTTHLATLRNRGAAIAHGQAVAARLQRPFKLRGAILPAVIKEADNGGAHG